ncbi:YhdP family protein [Lysobacter solisilvae (ex Woo and Kim 2020)]|uniref:TIGR02099 family protein n=1 Tax=Agrilutibacter terrestris TaxID=2865112 RepID=A0A7H0FW19_9GAMM|nr:YhdP family protein [Lysobacter terrestris]QNP40235.1 TIGR02099 family protein [Lysobacter terrestris]
MPTPLRRRLRMARRGAVYTAAIVLVLIAVLLGAASQVLPLAERHPERIAAWLSERAGRPVAFDRVETAWTRRGPLLKLDNLRIGEGARAFTVGDTEMLVSVYAGLLPGHAFSELRLRGLDLTLERAADGRWQVRGLPGQQQAGSDPFSALEGLGELQVIGGKLAVIAPSLGIDARIPRAHLRLRVDGKRVRAGVRAWPHLDGTPLDAVVDFDRSKGDGRVYAGAKRVDLAAWSSLLRAHGIAVESGVGRAEAWAVLRDKRIAGITLDAKLDGVVLRGNPIDAGTAAAPPRRRFDHVEANAAYRLVKGGWRVDASRLRIGRADTLQKLDGLLVAGGENYAVQAREVDAGPLFAALALSDSLSPGLRRWLQAAKPSAVLRDVEVAGRRGGALRAHAGISDLGFDPVGKSPGVHGLGGAIDGDGDGFTLRFDPRAEVRFDWPEGFGVVHTLKLRGEAGGWREGAGWRVATTALRIDARTQYGSYGANARGGLWWQGDATRPWIDIAAEIDDTAVPVAKSFWLRKDMAPTAVHWLDTALVAGTVTDGRAVISGDLDDWPFRDNTGLFEATGRIRDATIRFNEGWPAAQGLEADTRFTGIGFDVDGTGRLGEVGIRRIHADIDDYRGGALTVKAEGNGDANQLLTVLKQSPLQKEHADTFANVRASGPADVGFGLELPLQHGKEMSIDGTVGLKNARLADPRWKLAFDQVNGTAVYSRGGFKAEDLAVRHEGEPGKLSLRAGSDYVRNAAHVFEAGLDASMGAAELIDRAEDMAWIKPYLAGRSTWTVGIAIPKSAPGKPAPTLLKLDSNLVGTALSLPAPMRKAAGAALATTIETPLPLGSGDILVGFGNVMALRARSGNGATGVRVALGASRVDEAAPASGLVASGRAETLDAIDWIALTRGGEGGSKLPLQRIDVTAHRLQLLGGTFPDTRVVVAPAARGAIAIQAEGAALEGALLVPASANEAIAGRMQRVYWRAATTAAGGTDSESTAPAASTARATSTGDDIDPANIPALTIDMDELRLGDARLGEAKVRTRPTAAGMRIEQLQTRAPKHRIDLSGDWTGRGAAANTRLKVDIGSDDFGALLAGFGMGKRLGGGEGTVKFDAGWPGSPVAFRLDGLEGSLQLDAREGRLLEIEPGAGRVLGLLSLAQLPKRLTLDFRDFFSKGFAFNEMKGTVRFGNGQARSDKLLIDGPAATIDISGTANLHAQSFDQTIEVRPKAGNLLTAIGAVAGGPVGAAIGAAANVVLSKPIGSMAAKTYRVTGPWKEPKVEVISREQGRVEASLRPPAG